MRAFALILLVSFASVAGAEVVTWKASGTLTSINTAGGYITEFPAAVVGTPFSIVATYNSSSPLSSQASGSSGIKYRYTDALISVRVFIDGIEWLRANEGFAAIDVLDDYATGAGAPLDGFVYFQGAQSSAQGGFAQYALILRGPEHLDIYSGPGLPTTPSPLLTNLATRIFQIIDETDSIVGTVDEIEAIGSSASTRVDVTAMADASGDGTPDVATFVSNFGGQPTATLSSGADGSAFNTLNFLNPDWDGVAIDTVDDANGDGVADDPAVAMLLVEPATGKLLVQARVAGSGANVNKINFLNADWQPIDIVVFNDPNGDGNPDDAAIGVMAVNTTTGKILLQVRNLSNGAKIATRSFLNPDYTAIATASVPRVGLTPLLGVLGVEKATGKILVQTRQLSDGLFIDNRKFLDTNWTAQDLAVVKDGNSDGTADDPGWIVLANNNSTAKNLVQARFAATGSQIKNTGFLTTGYYAQRIAVSADISGNGREEVSVFGERLSNSQRIVQVRDFDIGSRTLNIFP